MKNLCKIKLKSLIVLGIAFAISSLNLSAQSSDSLKAPGREFKNTIRFNVTNPLIFGGKSIIFGYERILKNNRSFSVNIGQSSFGFLDFGDDTEWKENSILNEGGFHLSGDYRWYLSKLNKYNAPRGVYIGPYASHNSFNKKKSWDYTSEGSGTTKTANSEVDIKINQIGVQLGYQFVFWKRFSVDLVLLGPGIASYKIDANVGGNLSDEDRQKFLEKLDEALKEKFPGYDGLNLDGDGDFERKGTVSTTSLGYRYMIMIGYRF
jgi:hypothetical protein